MVPKKAFVSLGFSVSVRKHYDPKVASKAPWNKMNCMLRHGIKVTCVTKHTMRTNTSIQIDLCHLLEVAPAKALYEVTFQ